ncbi:uncharacterized protein APUU_71171S [Aspergillus puulaauensis]|uniref:Transcription factor domain-containing protein n=1 Tax=Aspergillus puulaauensis TaxID=1220207 RepID=A0A7R7XXQ9_9EURO|nr:uncharacterized protein APUU_71171S [Aspergillus puulaauensis]BCS29601.1 hypothetical protein APUU_71171S [Aspergillus puulaauensis]
MEAIVQIQNSHLLHIINRLDALENGTRSTTESPTISRPSEVSSSSASPQQVQPTPGTGRLNNHANCNSGQMSLKGYRFSSYSTETGLEEKLPISPETAKSWLQMLYDNQNSLGILLPIARDFMLTIPSIVDNPYVQIDVRVLILYYGALHQGMLLTPGIDTVKKSEYSILLYRRALHLMEDWQREEQINELSLHVAFWMTFETYSQSDFDLSHRLHRCACDIARALGLLDLDSIDGSAITPASSQPVNMDTVYRGVHRIYFWQILMMFDNLFRNNLYRAGSIEMGTWKVSLPDLSTWRSFNDGDRHAQVYFEVSLRLARISLKHSELRSSMDLRSGEDGMLDASAQAEVMNLVLEISAVISDWNVEPLLMQASSTIHASLYAKLIFDATSMITSSLRIQPQGASWPPEHGAELELDAARRSITAVQRLFELDPNVICWHLGYFKSYITPCIGIIFKSTLTTDAEETATSNITLILWIDLVLTDWESIRKELNSMKRFVQTLRRFTHTFVQQKFRGTQTEHGYEEPSALSEAMRRGVVEDILDVAWQTSESRSPLPGSPTTELLGEDELRFLHERGVDLQQLYNDPCQAILELEKSILTEPDPHRGWWTFDV